LEQIVLRYGVIAIFLGAGIEGEPFALAGGVLAHRHWLSMAAATLAAIGGAFCVDQSWFLLSRRLRGSRMVERVRERPAFARALALIDRYPIWFVLLFRFVYGLRAVAAVAIGASRVPALVVVAFNLVAAIVWGVAVTALGYSFGPAFEAAEARYGSIVTLAAIGVSMLALVVVARWRR